MSDEFEGLNDFSFDDAFDQLALPWLPWVGSSYQAGTPRTIILGESVYDYGAGQASIQQSILRKESLRRRHMSHGILARHKSRFVRNFERAVFLKKRLDRIERTRLWSQVVYHNLVLRMMPSLKSRPTCEDYLDGWRAFLPLTEVIGAQRCIVYGLEHKKIAALKALLSEREITFQSMKLDPVGKSSPVKLTYQHGGQRMELFFIRHPSAFFQWREWGHLFKAQDMLPIHPG